MTTKVTYKGYQIAIGNFDAIRVSRVKPAIYVTTSINKAWRWIDGYRDGEHWAVSCRLTEQEAA